MHVRVGTSGYSYKEWLGRFYPDKLPLDTDNDLIVVNDAVTPAVGEITYLSGRVLDGRGDPVRKVGVERRERLGPPCVRLHREDDVRARVGDAREEEIGDPKLAQRPLPIAPAVSGPTTDASPTP